MDGTKRGGAILKGASIPLLCVCACVRVCVCVRVFSVTYNKGTGIDLNLYNSYSVTHQGPSFVTGIQIRKHKSAPVLHHNNCIQ